MPVGRGDDAVAEHSSRGPPTSSGRSTGRDVSINKYRLAAILDKVSTSSPFFARADFPR
jgi:hypothetical protein